MFLSLARLSLVFFLSVGVAQACLCDEKKPSVAYSYSKANVVFSGTVIARGEKGIWFKVDRQWKGAQSRTIYLYTGNATNACYMLHFVDWPTRWLIYGYFDPLYRSPKSKRPLTYKLMSHACDRTVPLEGAAEDIASLDKLRSVRRPHIYRRRPNRWAKHNKSLDASGGSVFRNLIRPAMLD
jgi:hypothetical protein